MVCLPHHRTRPSQPLAYNYSKDRKVENRLIEQQKIFCSRNDRWFSKDAGGCWVHQVFDSKVGPRLGLAGLCNCIYYWRSLSENATAAGVPLHNCWATSFNAGRRLAAPSLHINTRPSQNCIHYWLPRTQHQHRATQMRSRGSHTQEYRTWCAVLTIVSNLFLKDGMSYEKCVHFLSWWSMIPSTESAQLHYLNPIHRNEMMSSTL